MIDISVPTAPTSVAVIPVGDDGYVAVTDSLLVLDLSDPSVPAPAGSVFVPGENRDIEIVGRTAFLAGSMGLTVCDIGDPAQPVVVGIGANGFTGYSLARRQRSLVLGGFNSATREALLVMPLDCSVSSVCPPAAADVRLAGIHPNPFNPHTTVSLRFDRPQRAAVTVYDLAGRRMRGLAERVFTAGDHEVSWNGCDDAGRAVASGMYLI